MNARDNGRRRKRIGFAVTLGLLGLAPTAPRDGMAAQQRKIPKARPKSSGKSGPLFPTNNPALQDRDFQKELLALAQTYIDKTPHVFDFFRVTPETLAELGLLVITVHYHPAQTAGDILGTGKIAFDRMSSNYIRQYEEANK